MILYCILQKHYNILCKKIDFFESSSSAKAISNKYLDRLVGKSVFIPKFYID